MGKFTFFVIGTLLLTTTLTAQQSRTLKGMIADSIGRSPLVGARIDLFSMTDSASAGGITDKQGAFELKGLRSDSFRVLINMIGYPLITRMLVVTDSTSNLGTWLIAQGSVIPKTDSNSVAAGSKPAMEKDSTQVTDSTSHPGRTDSAQATNTALADSSHKPLIDITGTLQDKADKSPLAGATVNLSPKRNRSLKLDAVSNGKGGFTFTGIPADTFVLSISSVGYEFVDQQINPSATPIDLGVLFIPKKTKDLAGITIIAKTPPAQQKGDTLQFNASAFKVNPDATTEDLIKKMPGVTVDKDGTVTAQGDQVKKVTIDGKDFLGDDATAALRNLPSDVVDKIQVFDKLSDQAAFTGFDDGNSVKSINIVTKNGIKNGQFGRVFAGAGTDSRYSAGGNVSTFNGDRRISVVGTFNNINQQNFSSQDLLGVTSGGGGGNFGGGGGGGRGGGGRGGGGRGGGGNTDNFTVGQQSGISKTNALGINYTDKWSPKLDVQASYFFNNSTNTNQSESRYQTPLGLDTVQFSDQNNLGITKNTNHRFNMRLEYKFDSSNSLLILPSLNFQHNSSIASGFSEVYNVFGNQADTSSTSDGRSSSIRSGYNLRNNILYRHSFAKRGRTLSLNLGTTFNKNDGTTYIYNDIQYFKGNFVTTDSLQNQYKTNPTHGYTLSANLAYTEPVGKRGQLQFNYAPSQTKNYADQQTFAFDTSSKGFNNFRPDLSNKFDNTITTNNGGISYRLGASRDNQFSVGVNLQNSKLESMRTYPGLSSVNQSFTNLLPNLLFRRKLSQKSSINIFYRASTIFPNVTQLQDVIDPSNPLRVTAGNPNLKQAYANFLSARYTFTNTTKGQSFFANVFLQTQSNYISNAAYVASSDSVLQQGVKLNKGSQFSKPVNLDGYKSLRTFLTFSQPVAFIKSVINLSTGFTYSRLPGVLNYQETITNNYIYSGGVVIASNVSQYVDFNLSYNANVNDALSTGQDKQHYINQAAGIQFNLLSKSGWFLQNDLTNQRYTGLTGGFNQDFWLWNASIGKKFLKNQAAELKLSAFDLLKQNQSITRTVSENNVILDTRSTVLQQYFLLTFTYSLKNFGNGKAPSRPASRRSSPNF